MAAQVGGNRRFVDHMEVCVAAPSGDVWSLDLPHTATGADLKARMAELTQVPANRQRLFCGLSELHAQLLLAEFVEEGAIITFVVACSNYSVFMGGGQRASIRVMDTGERRQSFRMKRGFLTAASVSPDGSQVVTANSFGELHVWSVETGARICSMDSGERLLGVRGHRRTVFSALFSPDGSMLLTASDDGTTQIRDPQTGRCMSTIMAHEGIVFVARFAPYSPEFVTAGADGVVCLWDIETSECVQEFRGHTGSVHCAAFSPSGLLLLTTSRDRTLRLWEKETGDCKRMFHGHVHTVLAASFSQDEKLIVSASADHTAKVWSAESGDCTLTLSGHKSVVNCAVMSHDGLVVLTGSDDGTARVWNLATGDVIATLRERGVVQSAAFLAMA